MNKWLKVTLITLACVGIIAWEVIPDMVNKHQKEQAYEQAQVCFENGEYTNARNLLFEVDYGYRDAESLMDICQAHIYYEQDEIYSAILYVDDLQFKYQTDEQMKKIDDFIAEVNEKYTEQKKKDQAEMNEIRRQQAAYQAAQKEAATTTKNKRPYKSAEENDYLNADRHSNAEDFYDENHDYFDGFEEAAEYYEQHSDY